MNSVENRPRILIIGHARHGKDSVAQYLSDTYGLRFFSSSEFVGKKAIWRIWGKERYDSFEDMFEDRVNHRELWSNLINAYNTPDKARTAREMLEEEGADMYVGMRMKDEFDACIEEKLFTHVLWVDASERVPPENNPKMQLRDIDAEFVLDNNGNEEDMYPLIDTFVKEVLLKEGYYWDEVMNLVKARKIQTSSKDSDVEVVDMESMPEGAIPVLNHGYVYVPENGIFGSDQDIAEAARLSYGRGTKKKRSADGLINYLWSNQHTSPFEMAEIKLQIRMPIFVMRQWVRHRTANLNEYSGRYSVMPKLWYVPETASIRSQSSTNKQGSDEPLDFTQATSAQSLIDRVSESAFEAYEELLNMGVSREMARIVLPLNMYTEVVWKMDLKNLFHFIELRNNFHAQPEIRAYASVVEQIVEQAFPLSYAAFKDRRARYSLSMDQILKILTGSSEIELSKRDQKAVDLLMDDMKKAIPESLVRVTTIDGDKK